MPVFWIEFQCHFSCPDVDGHNPLQIWTWYYNFFGFEICVNFNMDEARPHAKNIVGVFGRAKLFPLRKFFFWDVVRGPWGSQVVQWQPPRDGDAIPVRNSVSILQENSPSSCPTLPLHSSCWLDGFPTQMHHPRGTHGRHTLAAFPLSLGPPHRPFKFQRSSLGVVASQPPPIQITSPQIMGHLAIYLYRTFDPSPPGVTH